MRLASVGKRYGRGPWLFEDVTLDIEPGQVVAIGGANGSGKSTLLTLLAGLTRPTVGSISTRPQRIGYVPERFPSTSRLSAHTYLAHMGRIRGLPTTAAVRTGDALLDRFRFTAAGGSALQTLSKGNAQKVALAQALLVPPELLVLDEPWTGLDQVGSTVLAEVVAEIAAGDGMVVLSTHPGVPAPAVNAHEYLLVAGSLIAGAGSMEPVSGPMNHVVLRRQDDSLELPTAWSGPRFGVETDGLLTTCTVPTADCDQFLLDCLRRGWSVVAVRPDGDGAAGSSARQ